MQQKLTVASALLIGLVLAFGPGTAARAEPPMQPPPPGNKADLAKQAQNPIASLISLPLQNNFNFGVGPEEELQYILNVQPVVPLKLNDDWNLITRTVVPLIYQPTLAAGVDDKFGLSDVQLSMFLSPTKTGVFTWGVGPVLQFPTATDEVLGTEKWAAGPTGVALLIKGPWVVGALVNQLWSFGGDNDRADVSQLLLQRAAPGKSQRRVFTQRTAALRAGEKNNECRDMVRPDSARGVVLADRRHSARLHCRRLLRRPSPTTACPGRS